MDTPAISVIIPVYNHARELKKCATTLKQQTFSSYEVIFVDDGSTDNSYEVIRRCANLFKKSTVVRQKNKGAPSARNAGARHARADLLFFLDADILLKPHALEAMHTALMRHPECAFAYSSFYFGWKLMKGVAFNADTLKRFNYIHTSSLLRRAYFYGFDESLKKFQDWDVWLTAVRHGGRGFLVNEPLFRITPRAQGMSAWLPSWWYALPWRMLGYTPPTVQKYNEGMRVIRAKHHLPYAS